MKKLIIALTSIVLLILLFIWARLPEQRFLQQIQGPIEFPANLEISKMAASQDMADLDLRLLAANVPAQDEVLVQEQQNRAFTASMDGQIWQVDLKTGNSKPIIQLSLLPAGMVQHPRNLDRIFLCLSRAYPEQEGHDGPGIYELQISTGRLSPVATRVPKLHKSPDVIFRNSTNDPDEKPEGNTDSKKPDSGARKGIRSDLGILYQKNDRPTLFLNALTGENSQPVVKADDLAISKDGKRIYFTEPYDHPGAILGVTEQSRNEAITLGKNGNVWMVDRENRTVSLVAQNYSYIDGILLEYSGNSDVETSIIASEISTFRLVRLFLSGEREGEDEIVIEGLPGFPDGIDRDANGRIWVSFPLMRSGLVNWLHSNPSWKKIVLTIPQRIQPVSRKTALLALSPDGSKPLFYSIHDGSQFASLIVATPGGERIYLSIYSEGHLGLYTIANPLK